MTAYYNEFDPAAAAWLRELIKAGHIAPGVVDERSIEDVLPSDLRGFTQCHFFAGIGVWSYALRQAGWSDDRPVWTGSCPCQPFSAAGKGSGFDDERHLWPAFHHLIEQCRPAIVLGEQVASKDGLAWLDLVQTDLEGAGYACGAVDTCAAGFGAPHIRQRLYWVGYAIGEGLEGYPGNGYEALGWAQPSRPVAATGSAGGLAHADGARSFPSPLAGVHRSEDGAGSRYGELERPSSVGGVADTSDQRQHGRWASQTSDGRDSARVEPERLCDAGWTGPVNGHWRDADWLFCRDGKWRPVEPGTFPLVNGAAARVVRLRGYGNAINAAQAQAFIETVMGLNV